MKVFEYLNFKYSFRKNFSIQVWGSLAGVDWSTFPLSQSLWIIYPKYSEFWIYSELLGLNFPKYSEFLDLSSEYIQLQVTVSLHYICVFILFYWTTMSKNPMSEIKGSDSSKSALSQSVDAMKSIVLNYFQRIQLIKARN